MEQDYYILDELRAFIGPFTWLKLSVLRFNGLLGRDELIGANAKSFLVCRSFRSPHSRAERPKSQFPLRAKLIRGPREARLYVE
jgi:hypothetical protein